MRAAAAADGIDLQVVDAYRSWEVQAAAYEDYLAGRKNANVLPPGTSEHGEGLAVDFTNGAILDEGDPEWRWLQQHGREYGWYPISNETWHWEFRGMGA
jgi:LAS superfamily LD-carboxypeptidase LdcB